MIGYFEEYAGRPTARQLADALVDFVARQLEALAARHAPGFVLPKVFAGHVVGPDARSDLAHTLSLLLASGRNELAGVALDGAVLEVLRSLDGAGTDTFYSYRAAESLQRLGGYHGNPRLAELSAAELANLREAFDSSASAGPLREGRLPKNYAVVVARCEQARQQLGLLDDAALLDEMVERSRELLGRAAEGWIDDSNEERGRFDIYTPDMFLFAEPLAQRLGGTWTQGLRHVLHDVDALALPGGAIVWGRSIGALGVAMTIELAAVGCARALVEEPDVWLARAAWSLLELGDWFSNGVIRAHQHRSTMFYRGPARRLQMTLDVLGKLVQAALGLRPLGALRAAKPARSWHRVDRHLGFGAAGRNEAAGAWAHRSDRLAFVLPLVGGSSSDYLPAPRAPGLFETPLSGPISMVPVVHVEGKHLVAAGAPVRGAHRPGKLEVEYRGWAEVAAGPDQPPAIAGSRKACFRVDRRSLRVEESLEIEADPGSITAIALQIPELAERPLDVAFACDGEHRIDSIDVSGLAEYRSFWSELSTVHQLDITPATRVELRWSVTPQLRVASTAHAHPYNDALFAPLAGRVAAGPAPANVVHDPRRLREIDVLHLHWPEWWLGTDLERNRTALERLRDAGTRIVWTQHNLAPHDLRGPEGRQLYDMWAAQADAVIHHTPWGMQRARATFAYREGVSHRVIPHGHWGARFDLHADVRREQIESQLALAPCAIRLGIIGAPRVEKDVQLVLDAFHACSREDLQLLVVCLKGERVPMDPRICALPSMHVPDYVYYQRLLAIDAIVFPFRDGMLMTGTAFDAIGAEKAAIISDWPVLGEVFGEAAIPYGATREDLTACFDALSAEAIEASAHAMRGLKRQTDWTDIAGQTLELFESLA